MANMKLRAVSIIRDLASKTTMRDLARKYGMCDGYFQDACGRDGERVHNAVIRFPELFPDDIVQWAVAEAERRQKRSIRLREESRKLRNRAPAKKEPVHALPNYPSPYPQERKYA